MPRNSSTYAVRVAWDEASQIIPEEDLIVLAKTGVDKWRKFGVPLHILYPALREAWNRLNLHGRERVTVQESSTVVAAQAQPDPDLPAAIRDFIGTLTAEERQALLGIGPMLRDIYRAQKGGDGTAEKAWEWITGNIQMFARALTIPPPRKRGGGRH